MNHVRAGAGVSGALRGARVAWGTVLLLRPDAGLCVRPEPALRRRARVFARVLGARQLLEVLVLSRRRSRRWIELGAAVDGVHGASMLALAALRPDWRRVAAVNALLAGLLALLGLAAARSRS
jgi:hypothetical protein